MSFDLTLDNYRSLCQTIARRRTDCRFITYLKSEQKDGFIILRHDVDRKPERALRMALLEYELGIRSSYYFRSTKGSFDPEIMKRIEGMGHEIGYHYEALAQTDGDFDKAEKLFIKELKKFREHINVYTICSHGSPLSKIDNRMLWKVKSYKDYGIIGDASLSVKGVAYFTDTGGRWGSKQNIRDDIETGIKFPKITSTKDLEDFISHNNIIIFLNCHPERWTKNSLESTIQSMKDCMFNAAKLFFFSLRKLISRVDE